MQNEEHFERLREYQDLLMERVQIEKEIRDLPKLVAAQEEVLSRAKKSFVERNTKFTDSKDKLAMLREELSNVVMNKEKAEQKMDSITSPREFEVLNKEITEAGTKEDQLRKEIKKVDEIKTEAEAEVQASESLIAAQEAEINEKRAKIENDESSMKARIVELKKQEDEISNNIDPDELYKFERIIRSKNGVGIVPLKGIVCSGCSMILPAQFVNDVRQDDQKIHFCPYCSRVLFYQESAEQEEILGDIESGSLADLDDEDEESDGEKDDDLYGEDKDMQDDE